MDFWSVVSNASFLYTASILVVLLALINASRRAEAAHRRAADMEHEWQDLKRELDRLSKEREQEANEFKRIDRQVDELRNLVNKDLAELPGRQKDFEIRVNATSSEMQERFERLREYLQTTLLKDLEKAMSSFDKTISDVLGEMKSELVQGVNRIEKMETALGNRGGVNRQLEATDAHVSNLLDGET